MANTATSMYFNSSDNDPDYAEYSEARGQAASSGPTSLRFQFGDWTAECWAYMTAVDGSGFGSFLAFDGVGSEWFTLGYNNSGGSTGTRVYLTAGDGSTYNRTDIVTGSQLNQWHHHAAGRVGNLWVQWYDGVIIDSVSVAGEYFNFNLFRIGTNGGNYYHGHGYVDQVRVSSVARYGNFDIPTTQHGLSTLASGRGNNQLLPHHVKLLLQCNSTMTTSSGSGGVDRSAYGRPVVFGGTATVATGQTIHGANVAFYTNWASGNAVTVAHATGDLAEFQNAYGDWSWEGWFWFSGGSGSWPVMFGTDGTTVSTHGFGGMQLSTDGSGYFRYTSSGGGGLNGTFIAGTVPMSTWTHIVSCRVNGVMCAFVDGSLIVVITNQHQTALKTSINTGGLMIPWTGGGDGGEMYFDDFRVCNGQSAYTANFTPYGGLKNVAVNKGGADTDARHPSLNSHTVQMGQAINSTNANTYCLDFDGSADYLRRVWSGYNSHDRGTIFAWVYFDTVNAGHTIFAMGNNSDGNNFGPLFHTDSSGRLVAKAINNNDTQTTVYASSGGVVSAGSWQSVALVSDGTTYAMYVNGTAASAYSVTGANGRWAADVTTVVATNITIGVMDIDSLANYHDGKIMQVAYWGGAAGTTGVLDADAIAALHAAGKGYDIKGSGNTGNYDSWADDLKGYWRMGNHYLDSAGNVVIHDASGNGADMAGGSIPNPETWTTGTTFLEGWQDRGFFSADQHTAFLIQSAHANGSTTFTDSGSGFKKTYFDGSNDYANGTVADYRGSDTRGSIVAWYRYNGDGGSDDVLIGSADTAGTGIFSYLYVREQDGLKNISWSVEDGDTNSQVRFTGYLPNVWQCFVLTFDGTNYAGYYDGELVDTIPFRGSNVWWGGATGRDNVTIGALIRSSAGFPFIGEISQIGVWGNGGSGTTGVLSASDVSAINALGPGADLTTSYSTGLVDYWTFGNKITEGTDTGSTIYSQVSGGQDLTGTSLSAPYAGQTVTASGGPYHSAGNSVFGGTSMYFDGSDGKLTLPASSSWVYGLADFTIDLWICSLDVARYAGLVCNASGTGNSTEYLRLQQNSSGGIGWRLRQTTQGSNNNEVNVMMEPGATTPGPTLKKGVWHHIGAQRRSGQMELYVDGIFKGSAASTHNHTWGLTEGIKIGLQRDSQWFSGWMDEIRFSIGIARYSRSIERFANTFVETGDTGDAFTTFQIQANGAKNGTAYSDQLNRTGNYIGTIRNNSGPGAETVYWSNPVGDPFGGSNGALTFTGKNYMATANNTNSAYEPVDEDFTMECWCYQRQSQGATVGVFNCSSSPHGFGWSQNANNTITSFWLTNSGGTSRSDVVSKGHVPVGKWYHVAMVKSHSSSSGIGVGTTYFDGVADNIKYPVQTHRVPGAGTVGANHSADLGYAIGTNRNGTGGDFDEAQTFKGLIDQVRLSIGVARYGQTTLANTQQIVTSSNSDSGVVTSNSTFGSGTSLLTADAYTAVLLQGNHTTSDFSGADDDTFSDESASPGLGPQTFTNQNGVKLRHGHSTSGANSYFFDGTCWLEQTTPQTDFDMTGDWTWECWFMKTNTGAYQYLWDAHNSGTQYVRLMLRNTEEINFWGNTVDLRTIFKTVIRTWYHVAVQSEIEKNVGVANHRTSTMFVNGQKVDTDVDTENYAASHRMYIGSNVTDDYPYFGYMDGIRYSKGITRYGYTGTNVKAGLNAVHHSHCKLKLVSNTVGGDTHFDDISDQGNYWDQTPYNYYFDGGNGTGDWLGAAPVGFSAGAGVNRSMAMWFKQYKGGADTAHYIFQVGDDTWSTGNQLGMWINCDSLKLYAMIHGTQPLHQDRYVMNQWNLAVATFSSASPSVQTIYLNGVLGTTTDSSTTIDMAAPTKIRLNRTNNLSGTSGTAPLYMAQAGYWDGRLLSDAEVLALWELGPAGNWTTTYSTGLKAYYGMGNHNTLNGKPADTATTCYDRAGQTDLVATNGMYTPHMGKIAIPTGGVKHTTDSSNFGSSSIYFSGDTTYLDVPADEDFYMSYGDFTMEMWVRPHTSISWDNKGFFLIGTSETGTGTIGIRGSGTGLQVKADGSTLSALGGITLTEHGMALGSWSHLVLQRRTGVTEVYIDGSCRGTDTTSYELDQHNFRVGGGTAFPNGRFYADEIGVYKGVAKYSPVLIPGEKSITPSYLSNPHGNHFTDVAHAISDQLVDTPENNFCTMNPLIFSDGHSPGSLTYKEGNLDVLSSGGQWKHSPGTISLSSGKWYFEAKCIATIFQAGIMSLSAGNAGDWENDQHANHLAWRNNGIWKSDGASEIDYGYPSWVAGDFIAIAFDQDNKTIQGYKNGAVAGPVIDYSGFQTTAEWATVIPKFSTGDSGRGSANFGQGDPDGENNYTDDNEIGGFRFKPPAGYLAICTENLRQQDYASIGPGSGTLSDQHFDTVLYSGDGSNTHRIGGLNFQPDLVWAKRRNGTTSYHTLWDSVRGAGINMGQYTSVNVADGTHDTNGLHSFNPDGFTLGDDANTNQSANTFVAWCWKAGNGTVEDGTGSILVTRSTNVEAGFSIIGWEGTGLAGSIAHGLSKDPELWMWKARESTHAFGANHVGCSSGKSMYMSFSDAEATAPASTTGVFVNAGQGTLSLGNHGSSNDNGKGIIMYAWHGVEGFSKFGTYKGNGNDDGAYVHTGFRPAMILIKEITPNNRNWMIHDNKRSRINPCHRNLLPNSTNVEDTGAYSNVDFLANGFKWRSGSNSEPTNENDAIYAYSAWAEMPFKYARAR